MIPTKNRYRVKKVHFDEYPDPAKMDMEEVNGMDQKNIVNWEAGVF